MINNENHEGYLMRYADGALNAQESAEVEAYLKEHPELLEELEDVSFPALRVTPPDVEMPGKERMLKPETTAFPLWRKRAAWSAAAAVVLLFVAGTVMFTQSSVADGKGFVAELAPADSVKQTIADSLTYINIHDSLNNNSTQRLPVLLAESEETHEETEPAVNDIPTDSEIPAIHISPIPQKEPVLLADATQKPTRRIVGGVIIVETDNLVNIEPKRAQSSNPNVIRGYVVENSQLAMESQKGILGRAIDALTRRNNRSHIDDTLLAYKE